jgi:hypothetical protein
MNLREGIKKILKESEEHDWAINIVQDIQKKIEDKYRYVFIKDLNGQGFSQTFKTMDELIEEYGDWVNVDWSEVKTKLDQITDVDIIRWNDPTFTGWYKSRRIMIKSAQDPDNRWGYHFYVQKLLRNPE